MYDPVINSFSFLPSSFRPSPLLFLPPTTSQKRRASWRYFTGSIWRNFPSIINEIIFPSFPALPPPLGANLVLLRCCYLKPLTLSQLSAFLSSAKPRSLCREKSVLKQRMGGHLVGGVDKWNCQEHKREKDSKRQRVRLKYSFSHGDQSSVYLAAPRSPPRRRSPALRSNLLTFVWAPWIARASFSSAAMERE